MNEEMPQGKKTVSDEEIIRALREHDDPFFGAGEVADLFDHTRQWAHNRLSDLHEEGRIEKKAAGDSSVIWWVESGCR